MDDFQERLVAEFSKYPELREKGGAYNSSACYHAEDIAGTLLCTTRTLYICAQVLASRGPVRRKFLCEVQQADPDIGHSSQQAGAGAGRLGAALAYMDACTRMQSGLAYVLKRK